ncbi:MAG: exodeoxyribonuclease VII large subunit [Bacteroidales bacterium]|jgi:exodeoxyribonuclease VII large subunit|nr:exodeoxyribonuclease VII large subunit [Bacteroidales bacterium]
MESFSLLELNRHIRQALRQSAAGLYWVTAEINGASVSSAGHCFLELIEKESAGERIVAKAKANIWASRFAMLHPYFKTMTGQELSVGLKVMLQVSVEFHELYGFSLQVTDINPVFTVGDLALQKQSVLRQLTEEGVIDMNRELELPAVPQRIAVISSETAAGYGDFCDQLHHNGCGYAFRHTLFPAVMQGNEAENSIIDALERIFEQEDGFDVVAIIRGGGSQSDLNCFNSYRMACCMAQFPLPIITGIGHERDETIADRVAFMSLKTPTAVAEYLIGRASLFDGYLQELSQRLHGAAEKILQAHAEKLQAQSYRLRHVLQEFIHKREKTIQEYTFRLSHAATVSLARRRDEQRQWSELLQASARKMLRERKAQLLWIDNKISLLNPEKLLERGYSLTLSEGKAVRSISSLKEGQKLETVFKDGKAESVVTALNHAGLFS